MPLTPHDMFRLGTLQLFGLLAEQPLQQTKQPRGPFGSSALASGD